MSSIKSSGQRSILLGKLHNRLYNERFTFWVTPGRCSLRYTDERKRYGVQGSEKVFTKVEPSTIFFTGEPCTKISEYLTSQAITWTFWFTVKHLSGLEDRHSKPKLK